MSKKIEDDKSKKALFLQRFLAFCIDVILVSLLASIISTPFMDAKKMEQIEQQEIQLLEQTKSDSFDVDAYIDSYININYKTARYSGILSLVVIFLDVLYFVVYQIYNNGQTIGKKIMKIRVVSDDGELSTNQMIFRSFISNLILISLLKYIFMLFATKETYFYVSGVFELFQYLIMFISVIMIANRKDGKAVHDLLFHTSVVRE